MRHKRLLAIAITLLLVIIIPVVQAMFFSHRAAGKILRDVQIDAPYLDQNIKDVQLLFYGYVGCQHVCTPILHNIDHLYSSDGFTTLRSEVGITFVSLIPQDERDLPNQFAKSFNPAFEGIDLTNKEVMGIDRSFGVYFARSLSDPGELDYADNLYLVSRQKDGSYLLHYVYSTHPIDQQAIIDDILMLLERQL